MVSVGGDGKVFSPDPPQKCQEIFVGPIFIHIQPTCRSEPKVKRRGERKVKERPTLLYKSKIFSQRSTEISWGWISIQITSRSVLRMRKLLQASQTCFTNRGQKQTQRKPLCHEEWAPPTQTRIQFPHNKTGPLTQHLVLALRIPLVVDGCDLVDPDAQDLLDPLSSWEGKKPYVPPAMMVPCPPDRWKHEAPSGPGGTWRGWCRWSSKMAGKSPQEIGGFSS
jgi:hypothetical protein